MLHGFPHRNSPWSNEKNFLIYGPAAAGETIHLWRTSRSLYRQTPTIKGAADCLPWFKICRPHSLGCIDCLCGENRKTEFRESYKGPSYFQTTQIRDHLGRVRYMCKGCMDNFNRAPGLSTLSIRAHFRIVITIMTSSNRRPLIMLNYSKTSSHRTKIVHSNYALYVHYINTLVPKLYVHLLSSLGQF